MTTTPTLGLTQFEATDTINFLTQYNTDLSKIDTNAKMTKAIGSDYIYSYTTAPSYSGGTVTLYAGTKYVCADGRDANGDIKQTVLTLSTNKTLALTGTLDFVCFISSGGTFSSLTSVYTSKIGFVNFITELPISVPDTELYCYYVTNEQRYYKTSGSTTANWSAVSWCKVASIRMVSSTITYFKPNLQLNLAQKIGKDKLLMTMADVNANTDKEFVPSAVAVKELLATLGVKYIVEKGSNANGNYEIWSDGTLKMWGISSATVAINNPNGSAFYGTYSKTFPKTSTTPVSVVTTTNCTNGITSSLNGNFTHTSDIHMYVFSNVSLASTTLDVNWYAIGTYALG